MDLYIYLSARNDEGGETKTEKISSHIKTQSSVGIGETNAHSNNEFQLSSVKLELPGPDLCLSFPEETSCSTGKSTLYVAYK